MSSRSPETSYRLFGALCNWPIDVHKEQHDMVPMDGHRTSDADNACPNSREHILPGIKGCEFFVSKWV